ncbi:MAG: Ig-like domain-containing protein [Methanobacteriaceae archaeon]|nr:Ig-like domain-containing protein [Methanobacteriaceae archaeon]
MIRKNMMALLVFFVLVLGITAVTAADTGNTTDINSDSSTILETQSTVSDVSATNSVNDVKIQNTSKVDTSTNNITQKNTKNDNNINTKQKENTNTQDTSIKTVEKTNDNTNKNTEDTTIVSTDSSSMDTLTAKTDPQTIYLTNSNYNTYFYGFGTLNDKTVNDGDTIIVSDIFNEKGFKINKNITFTNQGSGYINNCILEIYGNGNGCTISNLRITKTIDNIDQNGITVKNVNNVNIYNNTISINTNITNKGIEITNSNQTNILNNTIVVRALVKNIVYHNDDYGNYNGLVDTCGIAIVNSSSNIVKNNNLDIGYSNIQSETNTLTGIVVQGATVSGEECEIKNNTIENNIINYLGDAYSYGVTLQYYAINNSINNNTLICHSNGGYVCGIYSSDRISNNNIRNNNININSKYNSYGICLEGSSTYPVNNTYVTYNTINGNSTRSRAIESYYITNSHILFNHINITGTYANGMGCGAITYSSISNNTIQTTGTVFTQDTGYDNIPYLTDGIYVIYANDWFTGDTTLSDNNLMYYNNIITNGIYAIDLIGNNNKIKWNTLKSASLSANNAVHVSGTNNTVINNYGKLSTNLIISPLNTVAGKTIQIKALLLDENNQTVSNSKISFKINQKTIGTAITNKYGIATIEYLIPITYQSKNYTITAKFGENNNYKSTTTNNILTINKLNTISYIHTTSLSNYTKISAIIKDSNGNYVTQGKVAIKINGKTIVQLNTTNGNIEFNYNKKLQINYNITIIYGENNKYLSSTHTTTYKTSSTTIKNSIQNTLKTSPQTHVVNQNTILNIFNSTGLTSIVSNGDTLDFQGYINITNLTFKILHVDKSVNIISSTNNALLNGTNGVYNSSDYDSDGRRLEIDTKGSYTNITGLKLYNVEFFIVGAHDINVNNLNSTNERMVLGAGNGVHSIREGSTNINLTNCIFKVQDNGGHGNFVGAGVSYMTLTNCTIYSNGTCGNVFYLTNFNTQNGTNGHNTLINSTVIGPDEASVTTILVAIHGTDTCFDGCYFSYPGMGQGIMLQYGDTSEGGATIIINNIFDTFVDFNSPCIATNNTAHITFNLGDKSIITRNNLSSLSFGSNSIVENNTVLNGINTKGNSSVIRYNNITSTNNYAVTMDINSRNNTIAYNTILASTNVGNEAVQNITGNYVHDNIGSLLNTEIQIKNYYVLQGDIIILNSSVHLVNNNSYILNQGNVTFLIDNVTVGVSNVTNGIALLNYTIPSNMVVGDHIITVIYNTNTKYASCNNTSMLYVDKKNNINMTLNDVNGMTNIMIPISVEVFDGNEKANTGVVTFKINNVIIGQAKVVNGYATLKYNMSYPKGIYNITAIYTDDVNNVTVLKEGKLNVSDYIIIVDSITAHPNEITHLISHYYGSSSAMKFLSYYLDGNKIGNDIYSVDHYDYNYTVPSDFNGTHIIKVEFWDGQYSQNEAKVTGYANLYIINNTNINTFAISENIAGNKNDNITLKVDIYDENNCIMNIGNATFFIDDVEVGTVNLTNGTATLPYTLTSGIHNYTVVYNGYGNYTKSEHTSLLIVKDNTTTTINNITTAVGNNITLNATITDNSNNNLVIDGIVEFFLNGTSLGTVKVINGSALLNYSLPVNYMGNYNISAVFTSDYYYNSTGNGTLIITKINTQTTVMPVNRYTVDNVTIMVVVMDSNNNPINAGMVYLYDNNYNLIGTGNVSNSLVKFNKNYLIAGNYTVTAVYNGTEVYNTSSNYNDIIINLTPTIITIKTINGTTTTNTTLDIFVSTPNHIPVTTGIVTIYNGNKLLTTETLTNGSIIINTIISTSGLNNLTIVYNDSTLKYRNITTNITVNIQKTNTTITVNPIKAQVKDNITITAIITDANRNLVNGGNLIFKINGVTIKDNNNTPIKVQVINGTATLQYTIPDGWVNKNYTITAVYAGNNKYNSITSTNASLTITKRIGTITLLNSNRTSKAGNTIQLITQVSEKNTLLNEGCVIFKINGKTIVDTNGKAIQTKVINGIAILNYTIPKDFSAKEYNITSAYISNIYERAEAKNILTITKINTHINTNPIMATKGTQTTINATILNENNIPVTGTTKISIKFNGKTITTMNVTNGIINYNYTIPTNYNKGYYNLTIIAGENSRYNTSKINSTIIVNNPVATIKI